LARWLEPLHLTLSSSDRLVRHLSGSVPMLDTGQDFTLGGAAVAPQLIGHDHPRYVLQVAQQLAECVESKPHLYRFGHKERWRKERQKLADASAPAV
jgi:hypothetical protein